MIMKALRNSLRLLAVAVALTAGAAFAEKIDNPLYKHWAQFKPGTTATVKTESDMAGNKSEMENTSTLVEVTADKAVVETKMSMVVGGSKMDMPASKMEVAAKIDKVDTTAAGTKPAIKESTEDVDVAGTKVSCKVVEMTNEANGMKTVSKSWTSDKVPGMMVKMESTMDGAMKGTTKMMMTSMTIK
jgi:hypothetical protein